MKRSASWGSIFPGIGAAFLILVVFNQMNQVQSMFGIKKGSSEVPAAAAATPPASPSGTDSEASGSFLESTGNHFKGILGIKPKNENLKRAVPQNYVVELDLSTPDEFSGKVTIDFRVALPEKGIGKVDSPLPIDIPGESEGAEEGSESASGTSSSSAEEEQIHAAETATEVTPPKKRRLKRIGDKLSFVRRGSTEDISKLNQEKPVDLSKFPAFMELQLNADKNLTLELKGIYAVGNNTETPFGHDPIQRKDDIVTIPFQQEPLLGQLYRVKFSFNGNITDKLHKDVIIESENMILFFFEHGGASKIMPCFNDPDYMTPFQLSVKHPSKFYLVGNSENKRSDEGGNLTTTSFDQTAKTAINGIGFIMSTFERPLHKQIVRTKPIIQEVKDKGNETNVRSEVIAGEKELNIHIWGNEELRNIISVTIKYTPLLYHQYYETFGRVLSGAVHPHVHLFLIPDDLLKNTKGLFYNQRITIRSLGVMGFRESDLREDFKLIPEKDCPVPLNNRIPMPQMERILTELSREVANQLIIFHWSNLYYEMSENKAIAWLLDFIITFVRIRVIQVTAPDIDMLNVHTFHDTFYAMLEDNLQVARSIKEVLQHMMGAIEKENKAKEAKQKTIDAKAALDAKNAAHKESEEDTKQSESSFFSWGIPFKSSRSDKAPTAEEIALDAQIKAAKDEQIKAGKEPEPVHVFDLHTLLQLNRKAKLVLAILLQCGQVDKWAGGIMDVFMAPKNVDESKKLTKAQQKEAQNNLLQKNNIQCVGGTGEDAPTVLIDWIKTKGYPLLTVYETAYNQQYFKVFLGGKRGLPAGVVEPKIKGLGTAALTLLSALSKGLNSILPSSTQYIINMFNSNDSFDVPINSITRNERIYQVNLILEENKKPRAERQKLQFPKPQIQTWVKKSENVVELSKTIGIDDEWLLTPYDATYAQVAYQGPHLQRMKNDMANVKKRSTPPYIPSPNAANIIRDVMNSNWNGYTSNISMLEFCYDVMPHQRFYLIWYAFSANINRIHILLNWIRDKIIADEKRLTNVQQTITLLQGYVRAIVINKIEKIDLSEWEKENFVGQMTEPGIFVERPNKTYVRMRRDPLIFQLACDFKVKEAIDMAVKAFDTNPLSVPEEFHYPVFSTAIENDEKRFDTLMNIFDKITNPVSKRTVLLALGATTIHRSQLQERIKNMEKDERIELLKSVYYELVPHYLFYTKSLKFFLDQTTITAWQEDIAMGPIAVLYIHMHGATEHELSKARAFIHGIDPNLGANSDLHLGFAFANENLRWVGQEYNKAVTKFTPNHVAVAPPPTLLGHFGTFFSGKSKLMTPVATTNKEDLLHYDDLHSVLSLKWQDVEVVVAPET